MRRVRTLRRVSRVDPARDACMRNPRLAGTSRNASGISATPADFRLSAGVILAVLLPVVGTSLGPGALRAGEGAGGGPGACPQSAVQQAPPPGQQDRGPGSGARAAELQGGLVTVVADLARHLVALQVGTPAGTNGG